MRVSVSGSALFSACLCALLATTACQMPQNFTAASGDITADALRSDVRIVSANRMQGRAPGTLGDRRARQFLIDRMTKLGLEPGGRPHATPNEAWQQRFELVKVKATMPGSWPFEYENGAVFLAYGTDYVAVSGVQTSRVEIEDAELVFVGYGIQAPEFDWDDYKNRNLRGKVLVMLNNDPDWDDAIFEGERRMLYGRWTYKYEMAAKLGAAGAIIIHTTKSAGYPWQVVQTSWRGGERFALPARRGTKAVPLEAWMTEDAARQMFSSAGHNYKRLLARARSRNFRPVSLGVRTSIAFDNEVTRSKTANVLGVVRGTDPALADEYVVYSAHHDHLGQGGDKLDKTYNGARDNAAGVAKVLAIAKAMVAAPPKRSVLFAFVGAEESGLLGSKYFVQQPTVPLASMVANINFDGGNIWGRTRDVVMVGGGQSSLDAVVARGAKRQARVVADDPFPDRGYFYRSDQFNFARAGVPAIFLRTGTNFIGRAPDWGRKQIEAWEARHYHQVSDELRRRWNFDGMVEDARLGFYCGFVIANASARPRWNKDAEFRPRKTAAPVASAAAAAAR